MSSQLSSQLYSLFGCCIQHNCHGSDTWWRWWKQTCGLLSILESPRHWNTLSPHQEFGACRSLGCSVVFPLHPTAHGNRDFRLEPHDLHFVSTIFAGQVLQMDCDPSRIQFGVHYCQIKEITGFCWSHLLSPYWFYSVSIWGSYPRWNSLLNQHSWSMVRWYNFVPSNIYLPVRVDEGFSMSRSTSISTILHCRRYLLSCQSRFCAPSMFDLGRGEEISEWLS